MKQRKLNRPKRQHLKNFLLFCWKWLIIALASIVVIADRLICSFWITKDLPGIQEIDEFEHERKALAGRIAIYIVATALFSGLYFILF